ncbi:MAG TPA: polymer-forming cytoskeletal protein [Candidatus Omnitrophota bacterium]|nr:polymer-forming cytoskeletal protein [Candidatus Omnitrophota bacterium]HPD85275.1 polymer-forming cytoskeletal protein [Candidatus Omnitrophota bacterium]HRZ04224.1 polymer-forming cytoskeletal protein [Candidatus Omnitrophota bacterium]
MAMRDRRDPERAIEISADMQGTLAFKDPVNLKITGKFNGTLDTKGTLTVGETASVEAHINGENIIIAGKIKGDVTARKMLVLMPTATLNGNIATPKLNIVEGAIFQGKCQMFDEYLDLDGLAKYLEIDMTSLTELANTGKIPGTKNGNAWRFERTKIDEWAASEKVH